MDNLTHSLVGAVIGQAGLKRRTGLAMPALIMGANLPDISALTAVLGLVSLGMHRGITHGPIAWIVLPLLLTAGLHGFDRWQTRRGTRPSGRAPLHLGWLFALSLIGCLTHPALDWLNSHGVRFLEPFSHQWFYGDLIYIADIWLWLGLGLAMWLSMRSERKGGNWERPARIALVGVMAYIGANAFITHAYVQRAKTAQPQWQFIVADEQPITSWRRTMIVGQGDGRWRVDGEWYGDLPLARCDLASARKADPRVDAFLRWSRNPFVARSAGGWTLKDARYFRQPWSPTVELPKTGCTAG